MAKEISAKLYKINKGSKNQPCYKAITKREVCERQNLDLGDGLLLEINGNIFPTVLTKVGNSKGSFSYAFTIPTDTGKKLPRKEITLKLLQICKPLEQKLRKEKSSIILPIFRKTSLGSPTYAFDLNKKEILLWTYSRGCKPFKLPKCIPLEKDKFDLLEIAGAFFCEGLRAKKKGHNLDRLSFSNAEPEQIAWFIRAMQSLFKIKFETWQCQILFPDISINSIDKLKSFWQKIGLDKNKIKVYKNETVKAEHGVCIISISNSTLAEMFYQIFEFCKTLALQNKKYALSFFRGVSRGDIGISEKSKSIFFSTQERDDVEFFQKICNLLNLSVSEPYYSSHCWNLAIYRYESFKYLLLNNAIAHTKRRKALCQRLIKSKKSLLFKYLRAIFEGENTSFLLSKKLNLSQVTTVHYLRKFRINNYIRSARSYNNAAYLYSLTSKGKKVLNLYSKIERGENII